ncbi:transglutaminase-like domain-containing protein [Microbacterium sp. GXF7504]
MQRAVTAELDLDLAAPVDLILQVAVARRVPVASERMEITAGAEPVAPVELVDDADNRLHRLQAGPGPVRIRYEAVVGAAAAAPPVRELEAIGYLRPSRYAQSDEVFAQARRRFQGLAGFELLHAVEDDVAGSVTYSPGTSRGTDSAVTTLATGQGVCRDYAHLVIALLRAMDVPARYAAVYAPGLDPMDFHAVAEACIDGAWYVVDATRLAPRASLVRIATGRDAADCAFLSSHGGALQLNGLRVDARLEDAPLPAEDPTALVQLA